MNNKQVKILGSATSTGIPTIGCNCRVCTSTNPKDQRLRTSILLTTLNNQKILVDTTPDLRTQCLKYQISNLDYVILTHDHADHLHGIDDLRPFSFPPNPPLKFILSSFTHDQISDRFPYIFQKEKVFGNNRPIIGGGIPQLDINLIDVTTEIKEVQFGPDIFYFFMLPHGYTQTLGFFHEGFAYLIDCKSIPETVVNFLNDKTDLLIIDCLQPLPHQTHLSVQESFGYIKAISPKMAGLIHMNHHLSHSDLENQAKNEFEDRVFVCFDGQKLQF